MSGPGRNSKNQDTWILYHLPSTLKMHLAAQQLRAVQARLTPPQSANMSAPDGAASPGSQLVQPTTAAHHQQQDSKPKTGVTLGQFLAGDP